MENFWSILKHSRWVNIVADYQSTIIKYSVLVIKINLQMISAYQYFMFLPLHHVHRCLYEARTGKKYLQFIKRNSWIRQKLTGVYRAFMESAGKVSISNYLGCIYQFIRFLILCPLTLGSPWTSLHRPDSPYLTSWIRNWNNIFFTIPRTYTSLFSFNSQFCYDSRTWPLPGPYEGDFFLSSFSSRPETWSYWSES